MAVLVKQPEPQRAARKDLSVLVIGLQWCLKQGEHGRAFPWNVDCSPQGPGYSGLQRWRHCTEAVVGYGQSDAGRIVSPGESPARQRGPAATSSRRSE